jgi:transposase
MFFVRAYPRETQEMVFDAHDRAFAFFRGACTSGIYDNVMTTVDAIFIGTDRRYNRRFAQMCGSTLSSLRPARRRRVGRRGKLCVMTHAMPVHRRNGKNG